MYPEPKRFMPERYLNDGKPDSTVTDPATVVFGYGRRSVPHPSHSCYGQLGVDLSERDCGSICQGRYFAEASLFMIIATILHTLSISAPVGDDGEAVHLEGKMTQGLLS